MKQLTPNTLERYLSYNRFKRIAQEIDVPLIELFRPDENFSLSLVANIWCWFFKRINGRNWSRLAGNTADLFHEERCFGTSESHMIQSMLKDIRLAIFRKHSLSPIQDEILHKAYNISIHDIVRFDFPHYASRYSKGFDRDKLRSFLNWDNKQTFEWCPNSVWKKKAVAVTGKYFKLYHYNAEWCPAPVFIYCINYSTSHNEASSWEMRIQNNPGELLEDFLERLFKINPLTKEGREKLILKQHDTYYLL